MRSAHEGELKPDRGDPESNGLELITEKMQIRDVAILVIRHIGSGGMMSKIVPFP